MYAEGLEQGVREWVNAVHVRKEYATFSDL